MALYGGSFVFLTRNCHQRKQPHNGILSMQKYCNDKTGKNGKVGQSGSARCATTSHVVSCPSKALDIGMCPLFNLTPEF
jgi:hypothetical protein